MDQDPMEVVQAFVAYVKKHQKTSFIGIDPGSNGALAFVSGKFSAVASIPTIRASVKRSKTITDKERAATGTTRKTKTVAGTKAVFNLPAICQMFNLIREVRTLITSVVLEDVPTSLYGGSRKPGTGFHPAAEAGRRNSEAMLNRAYAMWPLFLHSRGFRVDLVTPSRWKKLLGLTGKEKEDSRLLALTLFPRAPLLLKKDNDKAEALLLIEYARRVLYPGQ